MAAWLLFALCGVSCSQMMNKLKSGSFKQTRTARGLQDRLIVVGTRSGMTQQNLARRGLPTCDSGLILVRIPPTDARGELEQHEESARTMHAPGDSSRYLVLGRWIRPHTNCLQKKPIRLMDEIQKSEPDTFDTLTKCEKRRLIHWRLRFSYAFHSVGNDKRTNSLKGQTNSQRDQIRLMTNSHKSQSENRQRAGASLKIQRWAALRRAPPKASGKNPRNFACVLWG
jgi:hypothetical protein